MRASRKGTRLNEVQYFKNPLPHTRQRMTTMFLLQRVSNLQTKYSFDTEDLATDVSFSARTKNRARKINLKDESIEMGSVSREDDFHASNAKEFDGKFHREVFVETKENLGEGMSKSILSKIDDRSDLTNENPDVAGKEKKRIIENDEIRGESANDERHVRRENKRHSSRWKNSWFTQLIFHLFSQIMGKNRRKANATNENDGENVLRKSRSYLGYRREENLSDERPREEVVSTFVRQIRRTRDKNLRVMLLQRELEVRLPKEDTSYARMYDDKLASPQLSSPLC